MALTKITTKGITDNAVDSDKLAPGTVTNAKIGPSAVESSEIGDGTVTVDDLASTLDLSSKTVTLSDSLVDNLKRPVQDNIALLGFKMAVNDGLTVFNLVDGIVDEFHDESGTDESEGSNDIYNAADDFYINNTSPTATPLPGGPQYDPSPTTYGFGMNSVTSAPTSTVSNNSTGTFTVPSCTTAIDAFLIGAAGAEVGPSGFPKNGGGGGFVGGQLAVTPGQVLGVVVGEGASGSTGGDTGNYGEAGGNGSGPGSNTGGGGASIILSSNVPVSGYSAPQTPNIMLMAGGGGGAGTNQHGGGYGGGGGGLTGQNARTGTMITDGCSSGTPYHRSGGGGDQEQGGQAAGNGQSGGFFYGGDAAGNDNGAGGGGAGFYGGGGGGESPTNDSSAGGGGSSYYGHPQVTLGITVHGQNGPNGAAWSSARMPSCRTSDDSQPDNPGTSPQFSDKSMPDITVSVACAADIGGLPVAPQYGYSAVNNGDGYVIFRTRTCAAVQSTTIMSTAFSATSVPTTSRIVVFEENVTTPTLNTDIIASVSRDGGSTFTNATLSDSGYVTGTSGQRILTGQATISGQPSGQSMRWKLALANNTVKIHGVALQWS